MSMGMAGGGASGDARRNLGTVVLNGFKSVARLQQQHGVADPLGPVGPIHKLIPVGGSESDGRVGEERLVVLDEPTGVVGVEVCADDDVDIRRLNTSGAQGIG